MGPCFDAVNYECYCWLYKDIDSSTVDISAEENNTESDTNENNGDGSSGGVENFVEIPTDVIDKMTNQHLMYGLVNMW